MFKSDFMLCNYSFVQCAGLNADNYQGAFSEAVRVTVESPETEEGIVLYACALTRL